MTMNTSGNDIVHASHVRLAYRAMLGRMPTDAEIRTQLAGPRTTGELLEVLTAAPEFSGQVSVLVDATPDRAQYANVWTDETARWTHPAGTTSEDGAAVVGTEGRLFLRGGTEAMVQQFTGTAPLPAEWADRWDAILQARAAEAEAAGAPLLTVVVPDRLAVHEAEFPDWPPVVGQRPALRLGDRVLYPLAQLQAAGGAYLRTDSHCSIEGNAATTDAVLHALGLPGGSAAAAADAGSHLFSGDLGRRFVPRIAEVGRVTGSFGAATIADDNHAAVTAAGGHLGTRRVLRNEAAADERTVVVFGDGHAFPSESHEGVAWFLAQRFREVHFLWLPFGWDAGYVQRHGAGVVISLGAERLLEGIPRTAVDAGELVAQAAESGEPVVLDTVFHSGS